MKKSNLNWGCKDKLKKKVQIVTGFNFKKNSRNKKQFSQCHIITPSNSNNKISYFTNPNTERLSSGKMKFKYSFIPHFAKMPHLNKEMINSLLSKTINSSLYCNGYYSKTEYNTTQSSKGYSQIQTNYTEDGLPFKNLKKNHKTMKPIFTTAFSSDHSSLPITSHKSTDNSKPSSSIPQLLLMNSNKLILANIQQSQKKSIIQLRSRETKDINFQLNKKDTELNNKFLEKTTVRRASLVDRFTFKVANPDGVIEDYITEQDKPGDKYKRFKSQLVKGKNKVYKLLYDVKKTQILAETMLNVYVTKIKGIKYKYAS